MVARRKWTAAGRPNHGEPAAIGRIEGSMAQPLSIVFKPAAEELEAYRQRDVFWEPPYWAHQGWLGAQIQDADWTEITELVDTSYRQVALKRQLAELDSRHPR
jgi:predicted DNA-binding protein (MmcQ/YjbR family)